MRMRITALIQLRTLNCTKIQPYHKNRETNTLQNGKQISRVKETDLTPDPKMGKMDH
jgi:hypothetical protein